MTINVRAIADHLGPRWAHVAIECHDQVDSTNDWLARATLDRPTLVTARVQRRGRGRRRRDWASPRGGIYVSVGWPIQCTGAVATALPLVVGVHLCEGLSELGVAGLGLKWPNDIVVNGAKLAGILVERVGKSPQHDALIIGVGLNASRPAGLDLPTDRKAVGLAELGQPMPKSEALIAAIGQAALEAGALGKEGGAQVVQTRWPRWDALAGRACTIEHADGEPLQGTAEGVADAGALRLTTAAGPQTFWSGECRVRWGWDE